MKKKLMLGLLAFALLLTGCGKQEDGTIRITNVSYDPTREFYEAYNQMFEEHYQDTYGETVEVIQSHGGSGAQARSVVEGCNADVVTLALEHDITLIQNTGLIDAGWKEEFSDDSSPYTSTIVFLVRKGNPKQIQDWNDLIREDVEVITPDPKSSGGACWNFLAALSYAKTVYKEESGQQDFMRKLYSRVSVMDSGARGATTTFVENKKGDVLVAWENEAITIQNSYAGEYEIINPSVSILAQPSVAIVDDNADANGTQEVSRQYLEYLYSDEAQRLIGTYGYRPADAEILKEYADKFDLTIDLWSIDDFGGWDNAYETYFDDGALFDQIYNHSWRKEYKSDEESKKDACDSGISSDIWNRNYIFIPDRTDPACIGACLCTEAFAGGVVPAYHEGKCEKCISDKCWMFLPGSCDQYRVWIDPCMDTCQI